MHVSFLSHCVSAHAGSGKTYAIVERFIYLLLHGVPIERILCITHTVSASQELHKRLSQSIVDLFHDVHSTHKICRLHGIFHYERAHNNIIRAYYILHDKDSSCIISYTLHAYILSYMQCHDRQSVHIFDFLTESECFQSFMRYLRIILTSVSYDAVLRLMQYISQDNLLLLLHKFCVDKYSFIKFYFCTKSYQDACDHIIQVEEYYASFPWSIIRYILDNVDNNIYLERALYYSSKDYDVCTNYLASYFMTAHFQPKKRFFNKQVYQIHPILNDFFCSHNSLPDSFAFFYALYKKSTTHSTCAILRKISLLWIHWRKKDTTFSSYCTFNDIMYHGKKYIHAIYNDIDHIICDEVQDFSHDQWVFLQSIIYRYIEGFSEHKKSFFLVGDSKQSIFSFHGSQEYAMEEYYRNFQEHACKYYFPLYELFLSLSYRSVPLILDFIDNVITRVLPTIKSVKHISYFQDTRNSFIGFYDISSFTHQEYSDSIICCINDIIDTYNASYQDILILFQRRNMLYNSFVQHVSMRYSHIPFICDRYRYDKIRGFQCYISFLKALCYQDSYYLYMFLMSHLIPINQEYLMKIIDNDTYHDLWNHVVYHGILGAPVSNFFMYFENRYSHLSVEEMFHTFMHYVFDNESIGERFIRYYSNYALIVIEKFMSILSINEKFITVDDLLYRWHMYYSKNSFSTSSMNTSFSALRIMSVHSAKGMEAPYVIIADASQKRYDRDSVDASLMKYIGKDFPLSCRDNNEYYRLLYVALSRAQRGMVFFGKTSCNDNIWSKHLWEVFQKYSYNHDERFYYIKNC